MTNLQRVRLARRVIARYIAVRVLLARLPLPRVVDTYSEKASPPTSVIEVKSLRRAVDRLLVLPGRPLRCLPRALVLYSMLIEEGHEARIAIGLPEVSTTIRAHAWVEVEGIDVGPSPGRDGHAPMVLYPVMSPGEALGPPEAGLTNR